ERLRGARPGRPKDRLLALSPVGSGAISARVKGGETSSETWPGLLRVLQHIQSQSVFEADDIARTGKRAAQTAARFTREGHDRAGINTKRRWQISMDERGRGYPDTEEEAALSGCIGSVAFSAWGLEYDARADAASLLGRLHFPLGDRLITAISHDYHLIYMLIPKCSSSTGRSLIKHLFNATQESMSPVGRDLSTRFRNYSVITSIRDPLSRFYSQYDEVFLRYGPWMKKKKGRAWDYVRTFDHPFPYLYDNMTDWPDYQGRMGEAVMASDRRFSYFSPRPRLPGRLPGLRYQLKNTE
ncbi:hypothetical protein THAOC_37582, partial [Thalassiosira oceanica]